MIAMPQRGKRRYIGAQGGTRGVIDAAFCACFTRRGLPIPSVPCEWIKAPAALAAWIESDARAQLSGAVRLNKEEAGNGR